MAKNPRPARPVAATSWGTRCDFCGGFFGGEYGDRETALDESVEHNRSEDHRARVKRLRATMAFQLEAVPASDR